MKTDWKDYFYSSISLSISMIIAILGAYFLHQLSSQIIGHYSAIASALTFIILFGLVCAIQARVLLSFRPLMPGTYSMEDATFTHWKLFSVLYYFGCSALKPITIMFLRPSIQVLFGATIGKDIALGGTLVDPHLIRIGNNAIIGEGSILAAHAITPGRIILAPILIEDQATVGVNAVVMPGVTLKKGAILLAGAVATPNTIIPEGQVWGGVPARQLDLKNH